MHISLNFQQTARFKTRQRPFTRLRLVHSLSERTATAAQANQHIERSRAPTFVTVHDSLLGFASSAVLAAALVLSSSNNALAEVSPPSVQSLYDGANVLSVDKQRVLEEKLSAFNRDNGWKVRVYTEYQLDRTKATKDPRKIFGGLDNRTIIVQVDPSSPNILNLSYVGDDVLFKLRRPFLSELQTRFGNMFYVREQGEASALLSTVDVLTSCLAAPQGCAVVPGLPEDQYNFTLACSVAGGLVAGFVSKIEPQGFVQRRWIWLLLFSPLWGSLFINFGLGPVVSRTSDLAPVLANTAAFAATAGAVAYLPILFNKTEAPPPSA